MARVYATGATRSAFAFLPLVLLALIGVLVAGPLVRDPAAVRAAQVGADPSTAPETRLEAAADILAAATAKDGAGYRFAIVQTSTLHARPDGPQIEVPDPADPHKSLGLADTYQIDTAIEHGAVTPDGFWMEMRSGPEAGKAPDFEKAPYRFGTLVTDGVTYRNDGDGWYETDRPPGIGLDPVTASLLPRLLRDATKPKDGGSAPADPADPSGTQFRLVTATGTVADIPGVIAVDGEPFTELTDPIPSAAGGGLMRSGPSLARPTYNCLDTRRSVRV